MVMLPSPRVMHKPLLREGEMNVLATINMPNSPEKYICIDSGVVMP